MARALVAVFGLAAFVSPAMAQTNTNCIAVGNQVTCNTSAPLSIPPPVVYAPAPQVGISPGLMGLLIARRQAQIQAQREEEQAAEEQSARDQEDSLHRDLGALIAQGQCEEAKKAALYAGRLDDAALVNQICAQRSPAAKPDSAP